MQKLLIALFLLVAAGLTTVAYHVINIDRILFQKAEYSFSRKEYSKAISYFNDALERGAGEPQILLHLAESYLAAGRLEDSRLLYERLLREQPDNPSIVFTLADIYSQSGRFDDAVLLYRGILRKDINNRTTRIQLARVLVWSGHFQEAIEAYKKALGEAT